ncbi:MAG TPA: DEAD/DEAH box helicase family protein [Solirubrobacteraceae bacterium]|nr:DEAD/DEAH box helicase family protein [Solirubrobacteraceae bacterium]
MSSLRSPASPTDPTNRTLRPPTNRSVLRAWQTRALAAMATWESGPFLISAAPGAGKTRPALEFARTQLEAGAAGAVVVACPTAPLTRQWARAAHDLGLDLAPDADSPRPPSGFHGVSVTYARIAKAPRRWASALPRRTLVIADEAHHLGEELSWGVGFSRAFETSDRWLLLSGTPFRSDATPIPGVSYDADGLAEPDVSYSYAEAVADAVCRPVCFVAYDGALSWRSGDDVIETSFETVLSTREASRRYRTAISTELPDGLPRILREADVKLRALRQEGHRDAGGLVVAADSEHARRIAKLLREATGRVPLVVLHAEPRAAAKLAAFTSSTDPWIVAVNMVSEGVDIPRLRVGVYATAAKTPLIFRQIVGRFVRTMPTHPPRPVTPSWLYVPADPVLRDHAATIEQELRGSLRRRAEADEFALDEREERRQTERTGPPEFEPLSADVTPQMSLFGSPEPAKSSIAPSPAAARWTTAIAAPTTPASASGAAGDGVPATNAPTEVPAFERRARLRDERHRLVSEVRRRDGTSHREINAWLNRKLGISSVEEATLADLERSVELLVGKLSRRR